MVSDDNTPVDKKEKGGGDAIAFRCGRLRNLHGFLNVNKPEGITSYDVIREIKKTLPSKHKIGHLGTLDPMATGVLPIALGKGTRLIGWIADHQKEYVATMTLGGVSDTQDADGHITYTGRCEYDEAHLARIAEDFTGAIRQIPPMYSAVRHDGQRLYHLARQGIEVERKERSARIYALEIIHAECLDGLPRITIRVCCSPGTYIRTLCHDMGAALGTGAFLSGLQRTRSGHFHIETAHPLDQITMDLSAEKEYLLPLDYVLKDFVHVKIDEPQQQRALYHGNPVFLSGDILWPTSGHQPVVVTSNHEVVALARMISNQEGAAVLQPIRVLTDRSRSNDFG